MVVRFLCHPLFRLSIFPKKERLFFVRFISVLPKWIQHPSEGRGSTPRIVGAEASLRSTTRTTRSTTTSTPKPIPMAPKSRRFASSEKNSETTRPSWRTSIRSTSKLSFRGKQIVKIRFLIKLLSIR